MTTTWLGIDIGIRNLNVCRLVRDATGGLFIKEWKNLDLLDLCQQPCWQSCDDLKINDVGLVSRWLFPKLFPRAEILSGVHHVCLEQQPMGKYANFKIVLVSFYLFEYFHSMWRTVGFRDTLRSVSFVSPQQKYRSDWLKTCGVSKYKEYQKRKVCSVFLQSQLQGLYKITNETSVDLRQKAKPDDYADSFLIALSQIPNLSQAVSEGS